MWELISKLFDTSDFPARWHCGHWTSLHGWIHIISDFAIWGAYAAIPIILYYFISKKRDVPFSFIFILFGGFILSCGTGHLVEAIIFWHPWYRFSALIKFATAVISWATIFALIPVIPKALELKSPLELEKIVKERTSELERINENLAIEVVQRKEAEEEQVQLAALVNSSYDAIIRKDLNSVIQSWNYGAEKIFGYTAKEIIGKSITVLIPPDLLNEEVDIMRKVKSGGPIETFESKRLRKDGSTFDASITISPINDTNGNIIGASKIARDITKQKQMKKDLSEAMEKVKQSNQELEMFAYVASHDLQEPLRMVASFTKLLEEKYKDKLDEKANKYIAFSVNGAKRMQELINSLLDYSRIQRADTEPEELDCNEIVNEVILNMSNIKETGVKINYLELPKVYSNKIQLSQVFQNLISNAIKYRSSRPLVIDISAKKEKDKWLFAIKDNGIGFDQEHAERIFELFERLHSTKSYEGTGMGLAICKKIIEKQGGGIWAESEADKGSTFYFTLPA
jgi:PAS domain S-box-containing protein